MAPSATAWVFAAVLALPQSHAMGEGASEEKRPSEAEIGSIQVYLTRDEARRKIFPDAAEFVEDYRPIPDSARAWVQRRAGRAVGDSLLRVDVAYAKSGDLLGYAIISEEIGKYRPITFMVGVEPDFQVRGAAVLVYRESRGGEVRRSRFLRQYCGKDAADPIRINRDIVNVSGATMSVRSLNFGVKKLLLLAEAEYGSAITEGLLE